jgi:poly-beta-1,6-N-acetyl-D-glucosamine synthase
MPSSLSLLNRDEPKDMGAEIHNRDTSYVLLTAAHNEEANIAKTLQSVVQQSALTKKWIIVSDNSTDRTDEIIREYAGRHDFIEFVRVTRPPGHNFAAKILALREGYKLLQGVEYGFIGNLDADISLEPSYFQQLRQRMAEAPSLGIAAGSVYEEVDGRFQPREHNRTYSVPHAAQLARRECYEAIGGYAILKFGGEDTHATTSARMKGWQARSFPDLKIYHQRHTGSGGGQLRSAFRQGQMEYHLGYDVAFEILKCISRMRAQPFLVAGFLRMLGFAWPYIRRDNRDVTKEFVAFIREEQRRRLSSFFVSRRMEPRA